MGSPKSESDLRRVHAHRAAAIFVIADSGSTDAIDVVDQDDYSTKLKVVSIVNYISSELGAMETPKLRPTLICQTISHEVCFSLLNFGVDRILSSNNMKYSIMAYAALFPGFLSIITNLVIPSSVYNKRGATTDARKWKNEFEWGNSFQLIELSVLTNCGNDFKRLSFSQVSHTHPHQCGSTCNRCALCRHVGCCINGLRDLPFVLLYTDTSNSNL